MRALLFRTIFSFVALALAGGALLWHDSETGNALVTTSHHKNTMWVSAYVNGSWHGGTYNEDALDLDDPDCTSSGACDTIYFRYQGLGQYATEYTLSNYGGSCTGRTYTVRYYVNGMWTPLIRLHFVHMQNMRASSQGQLSYSTTLDEWVGTVHPSEPCAGWSGDHIHYGRSTNYGNNWHNGASGFGNYGTWVGSNEVVFGSEG